MGARRPDVAAALGTAQGPPVAIMAHLPIFTSLLYATPTHLPPQTEGAYQLVGHPKFGHHSKQGCLIRGSA